MFAKIELVFQVVSETETELTLFSREDCKEVVIRKDSPIYKTITRSKNTSSEITMVTSTEMCGIVDEIPRNDLFYAEFTKREDGSKRTIHCKKVKYLPDGRVQVIDVENQGIRTFYKKDVLHISHKQNSYQVK